MQCVYSISNEQCPNEASLRVWCPTWINADKGPMDFCPHHTKVFDPELNPNASRGSFHWGENADVAFKLMERCVKRFDDEVAYNNAVDVVVRRGERLTPDSGQGTLSRLSLHNMNDELWLITFYTVLCLGNLSEARRVFPMLFVTNPNN